jgi:ribokinase
MEVVGLDVPVLYRGNRPHRIGISRLKMSRIVVIGSLNMDIVAVSPRLPEAGETLIGTHYFTAPGGKGANQAYAAALLGGDVAMIGRVGADDHGRQMLADLTAAGCNVSAVQSVDGPSGVAIILVAHSAQNSIVVIPGANQRYLPADLVVDDGCLVNAQFALLQLEIPFQTVKAAAQAAARHGARVILDPAPAPTSLPLELLRHVDILTPNEKEAAQLVGSASGDITLDEARAICSVLRSTGVKIVIIKLGARGCLLAQADETTWIAAPTVDAVDTTAAGDVFNGALAVACSEGANLVEACRFAVGAAALSVTRLGAQRSMPTREELNAFASAKQ